ncbi:hypothetical protein MBLNU457_3320t1 [Dothideomycetes sp. NU457]
MAEQQMAQAVRRWVMTGSVAAITAMGAWYGAGLKIQQDVKKDKQQRLEATPEERIQQLEDRRARLMRDRNGMQRKLDEIKARQSQKPAPP